MNPSILQTLLLMLKQKYKTGFSVDILEAIRKFYLLYQDDITISNSVPEARKSKEGLSPEVYKPGVSEWYVEGAV